MSSESALRERALLLRDLEQIIASMKNLAMAELHRLARMRPAQAQAQGTVESALATTGSPPQIHGSVDPAGSARHPTSSLPAPGALPSLFVVGAERGFCGAFHAALVRAIAQQTSSSSPAATAATPTQVLVASSRLSARLREELPLASLAIVDIPGCTSSEDVDDVLDIWEGTLLAHPLFVAGLDLLYQDEHGPQLVPLWLPHGDADSRRATAPTCGPAGLDLQLPLASLLEALERQQRRLRLHGALLASLDQENRWRLAQMQRAQDHLQDLGRRLQLQHATLRQSRITSELETLISGQEQATVRA